MDTYRGFAERYDWMKQEDPLRKEFFRNLFSKSGASKVLDCACGTGRDLLMFHSLGLDVFGSDLSDSMLNQAKINIGENGIPIRKADFCELPKAFDMTFDTVVCLSNSINEMLEDKETSKALKSMKSVLRPGGILVIDQGQTDASMQNPPRFAPIVNNHDFSRLFTIDYSGNIQTVNIFDFVHTEHKYEFNHSSVKIRIRLQDSWFQILADAGFSDLEFFGDWEGTPYSKEDSNRFIVVARSLQHKLL